MADSTPARSSPADAPDRSYRQPHTTPRLQSLPQVEKDADDPTHPPSASPDTERQTETTFTTLSRLLGTSSLSPEASRASSSIDNVQQQQQGYLRNLYVKEIAPLPDHLFTRGLCQGRHSDITVLAFGNQYKLHRIILDRAPFFTTALSGPWLEARSNEISIHPEDIDSNITQRAFELALKRLYRGAADIEQEDRHAVELFATGCWLELPDIVDASIESILRQMSTDTLGHLISLVTKNYYGRAGDKILASAKAMLCRDGWEMPYRHWDTIPSDIINEIVSSDGFYVESEWDRWLLAKKIVDRQLRRKALQCDLLDPVSARTKLKPELLKSAQAVRPSASSTSIPASCSEYASLYADREITPLLDLLDHGIHFVHLTFEQLQHIRKTRDVLGFPVLPENVISTALWQQMELRQRVLNCEESDMELGLAVEAPAEDKQSALGQSETAAKSKESRPAGQHEDTESASQDEIRSTRRYWIPAADCNIVMGGNSDPIISISHNGGTLDSSRIRRSMDGSDREIERPVCFSKLPPFRFSAEFPSPKLIKEKKRAYSRTVLYAGSLWNIYVQKVASIRSNKQLGVYLHRVKEREPEDNVLTAGDTNAMATVEGRIGVLERGMNRHRPRPAQTTGQRTHWEDSDSSVDAGSDPTSSGTGRAGGSRPLRQSSSKATRTADASRPFSNMSNEDTDNEIESDRPVAPSSDLRVPTMPPYIDSRPTIRTYFKIFSPSRGGRMLSVYESAPDKFNFSQSWGWKSSTLMLDEGLLLQDDTDRVLEAGSGREDGRAEDGDAFFAGASTKDEGSGRKKVQSIGDGKLRFMVVIGIL